MKGMKMDASLRSAWRLDARTPAIAARAFVLSTARAGQSNEFYNTLALARYRPSLRYFLLDEGRVHEEALDEDSLAAQLMRIERSEGPEGLREAINALRKKLKEPKYRLLNRAFVVWTINLLRNRRLTREILPVVNNLEELDTMLAERIGEWTEEWKREGMLAGLQEGRMEGRSAILSRLLVKRFGPDVLDSDVQERLRTAGPEQLDRWAERILDAESVDELFAE